MAWRIDVLTPAKAVFGGAAESVSLKTATGELTLLPDHVPLMGEVEAGQLVVSGPAGARRAFRIGAGGFEVTEAGVVVMVQEASAGA